MLYEPESVHEQNGKTHARKNFVVDSVSEFVKAVCTIDRCLVRNGLDTNEIMLFRGHADMNYDIVPSLGRGRKNPIDISIFNEERNMIEMAKFKMPNVFRNDMQPLELLALLQHHGIPTRLLDVTENALVALYFACCSEPEKDGEVIVFRHNEKHISEYPLINAIADTYRLIGTENHSVTLNWFFEGAIRRKRIKAECGRMKNPSRYGKDNLRKRSGHAAPFFIPSSSYTCTPSAYSARTPAPALTHSSCRSSGLDNAS